MLNHLSIFVSTHPSIVSTVSPVFQSPLDSDKEFALHSHMEKINQLFSGETVEEIFAALEADGSDWANKQLQTLNKMVGSKTTYSAIRLYPHPLGINFYVDIQKCRYIETMEK